VLWQRVNELKEAGFVDAPEGQGLQLTPLGVRLMESFSPLLAFAETWAAARRNP